MVSGFTRKHPTLIIDDENPLSGNDGFEYSDGYVHKILFIAKGSVCVLQSLETNAGKCDSINAQQTISMEMPCMDGTCYALSIFLVPVIFGVHVLH